MIKRKEGEKNGKKKDDDEKRETLFPSVTSEETHTQKHKQKYKATAVYTFAIQFSQLQ